jgi:hypothetical protein
MNIRGIANSVTQLTNPNILVTLLSSTGYTPDASGKRTPTTVSAVLMAQVQGLSASDLQHIDGLNIEGVKRSVHLYGNIQGVVRADSKGGDILQFAEYPGGLSRAWRILQVMETWATWCRVVVVMQ